MPLQPESFLFKKRSKKRVLILSVMAIPSNKFY